MKTIGDIINEANEQKYRAQLLGSKDQDGLPITVTILVNKSDIKSFEKYAEDEEGNTFAHIEGGNVEY